MLGLVLGSLLCSVCSTCLLPHQYYRFFTSFDIWKVKLLCLLLLSRIVLIWIFSFPYEYQNYFARSYIKILLYLDSILFDLCST